MTQTLHDDCGECASSRAQGKDIVAAFLRRFLHFLAVDAKQLAEFPIHGVHEFAVAGLWVKHKNRSKALVSLPQTAICVIQLPNLVCRRGRIMVE